MLAAVLLCWAPMFLRRASAAFLSALLVFSGVLVSAQDASRHEKLDLALRQALASGAGTQRVIIRVKPGATESVRERLTRHGDHVYGDHRGIGALSAEVHPADIESLAADQGIESMSIDALVAASATVDYESTGSAKALQETLGLTSTSPTGTGVVVALIDSGVAAEFDKENRVIEFRDFTNGGRLHIRPFDQYGHGSQVAGLIGGPSGEQVGVAPGTRFVVLKVLDEYGRGYTSNVISAIDFAVANKDKLGIDIINL